MRLERRVIYRRFSLLVSRQQLTRDRFVQDARNLFLTRLGKKKKKKKFPHWRAIKLLSPIRWMPFSALTLNFPSIYKYTHTHTYNSCTYTTTLSLYTHTPVEVLGVSSPRKSMTTASDTYWEHRRLDVEAAKRERLAKLWRRIRLSSWSTVPCSRLCIKVGADRQSRKQGRRKKTNKKQTV